MKQNKFFSTLTLMLLTLGLFSPVFAKEDNRKAVVMTADERNFVLEEMRAFLDAVRVITVSLANDDMASVIEPAKKMGMAGSGEVPPELRDKLPKEFKMLAMKTHKAFDLIALDAGEIEDKQQTLEQLGTLMGNCVSCHAIFKFETE